MKKIIALFAPFLFLLISCASKSIGNYGIVRIISEKETVNFNARNIIPDKMADYVMRYQKSATMEIYDLRETYIQDYGTFVASYIGNGYILTAFNESMFSGVLYHNDEMYKVKTYFDDIPTEFISHFIMFKNGGALLRLTPYDSIAAYEKKL